MKLTAVTGTTELTGEATVYVIVKDINDHSPSFDLPIYSTSVVEGQDIGQKIIQVTATDLDIGSNAQVRYTLVNDTAADSFTIDHLTGKCLLPVLYLCACQGRYSLVTSLAAINDNLL